MNSSLWGNFEYWCCYCKNPEDKIFSGENTPSNFFIIPLLVYHWYITSLDKVLPAGQILIKVSALSMYVKINKVSDECLVSFFKKLELFKCVAKTIKNVEKQKLVTWSNSATGATFLSSLSMHRGSKFL